tara:strand:- start:159 stop:323 length:165 start_codon:yes stop_codon:yes gene_type:complete
MCDFTPTQKSTVAKILKYWRNHHVSASDQQTQQELTLILDKLVGDDPSSSAGND